MISLLREEQERGYLPNNIVQQDSTNVTILKECSINESLNDLPIISKLSSQEMGRLIDQPWRGAEAYHYFMLAQSQIYKGLIDKSVRTVQLLKNYEDIINPMAIYSLMGKSGLNNLVSILNINYYFFNLYLFKCTIIL